MKKIWVVEWTEPASIGVNCYDTKRMAFPTEELANHFADVTLRGSGYFTPTNIYVPYSIEFANDLSKWEK